MCQRDLAVDVLLARSLDCTGTSGMVEAAQNVSHLFALVLAPNLGTVPLPQRHGQLPTVIERAGQHQRSIAPRRNTFMIAGCAEVVGVVEGCDG
jgi:hypothetical protein